MKITVVPTNEGYLIPVGEFDKQDFEKLTVGEAYQVEIKKPRNLKFHNKFMAMLRVAYEAWEPTIDLLPDGWVEKYGMPQKEFEHFRKDILIVCGYRKPVWSTKRGGELRFEATSISFANMDEVEFREVYNNVATYILGAYLQTYTKDDLDEVVDKMVGFL